MGQDQLYSAVQGRTEGGKNRRKEGRKEELQFYYFMEVYGFSLRTSCFPLPPLTKTKLRYAQNIRPYHGSDPTLHRTLPPLVIMSSLLSFYQ
jgi:hypothetical protein